MICQHGFAWSEVEDAGSFSVKGAEISQACHSCRILFGESRPKLTLYIDCDRPGGGLPSSSCKEAQGRWPQLLKATNPKP